MSSTSSAEAAARKAHKAHTACAPFAAPASHVARAGANPSHAAAPAAGRAPGGTLRILDVIRSLDPAAGGPPEALRQLVLASRRLGHHEDVLTLDAPGAPWLETFPARVVALGPGRGTYGYAAGLPDWLREHARHYDAVVVHGLWQYPGRAVWRSLRASGVPYLVWPHGMLDPWFARTYPLKHLKKRLYWRLAEQHVLADAAAVLFTTEEESRLAAQSHVPYRVRPQVVGLGIALDEGALRADAADFLAAFPALAQRRLVLFLGRLHPKKGCDGLLDAFAALVAEGGAPDDLHLVMAGPDSEGLRAGWEQRAQELGIAHRVTWTGMLEGATKWGALAAAEVFVLPSHQENFGIAVAEALALRLPVLLTRQVNTWREVEQAGAGFADEDTPAGTLRLLRRWLGCPSTERAAMRARARGCYQEHFRIDAAAERIAALVQTLRTAGPALRAAGLAEPSSP